MDKCRENNENQTDSIKTEILTVLLSTLSSITATGLAALGILYWLGVPVLSFF